MLGDDKGQGKRIKQGKGIRDYSVRRVYNFKQGGQIRFYGEVEKI